MRNSHPGTEVGFSALWLSKEVDMSKGNITLFFKKIIHKKRKTTTGEMYQEVIVMILRTWIVVTKVSPCIGAWSTDPTNEKFNHNEKEALLQKGCSADINLPREQMTDQYRPCRMMRFLRNGLEAHCKPWATPFVFCSSSPSKNSKKVNLNPAEIYLPKRPNQSHCPSLTAESLHQLAPHSGQGCTLLRWRTWSRRDTCGGAATCNDQKRNRGNKRMG